LSLRDPARALTPVEVAELLRSTLVVTRAELAALPDPALRWHPAPGEWCALEVLGHLIETEERGFAGRVRRILAEAEPRFETWDMDAVARARRDCEAEPRRLLEEWARRRGASAALVAGLSVPDLARGGHHPTVGHLRIADLLHEWVHHDRNHVRQLLANVQAFAWPHMGNAQRFSGGRDPSRAGQPGG